MGNYRLHKNWWIPHNHVANYIRGGEGQMVWYGILLSKRI